MRWEEEDGSREEGRQKNERGRRGSRREGTGRRVGRMKEFKLPPAPSSHLIPESVRLPSFPFMLRPLSSLFPLFPLFSTPASSLAPLFSLIKVIAYQFITKLITCTRNCRYELRIWFADGRQLAGTHLYSCIDFKLRPAYSNFSV